MLNIAKVSESVFSDIDVVVIEKRKIGFRVIDEDSGEILIDFTDDYRELVSKIIKHFNWTVCNSSLYDNEEFAILDDTEANRKDEDISFRFIMQA